MEAESIDVKNLIITAFKNSCCPSNVEVFRRKIAVTRQFQRNIWELNNPYFGLIRIQDKITACFITLFPLRNNKFGFKKETVFEITKSEYQELKKLYFGEFKEDKYYLATLNAYAKAETYRQNLKTI